MYTDPSLPLPSPSIPTSLQVLPEVGSSFGTAAVPIGTAERRSRLQATAVSHREMPGGGDGARKHVGGECVLANSIPRLAYRDVSTKRNREGNAALVHKEENDDEACEGKQRKIKAL